jgi:hypothetical protein
MFLLRNVIPNYQSITIKSVIHQKHRSVGNPNEDQAGPGPAAQDIGRRALGYRDRVFESAEGVVVRPLCLCFKSFCLYDELISLSEEPYRVRVRACVCPVECNSVNSKR